MDKLKSGNARTPAISPTVLKMLTTAWTVGSIDFNAGQVRTGFTILALVSDEELSRLMREVSREFQKINADALRKDLLGHCRALSGETTTSGAASVPAQGLATAAKPVGGKTPNLDQYTVDLTGNAKKGKIDPVLGRDPEIRQVIDILTRRRQNNPNPHRRSGRRQDRRRRRICAARRARRRSAAAQECHMSARSIWRCCRPARASRANSKTG